MWKSVVAGIAALLASAPVQASWHEARSKHFIVYADQEASELKGYAETLERFNAAVREARGVRDVPPGQSSLVTLYVLRDLPTLRRIYGDKDAAVAGFYLPKATGSVAFVPEKGQTGKWNLSADSIFFHEYTHHLMLQDADRPLPTWLSEGWAEFFANPEFKPDGSVVIGKPPLYRAEALYTEWRLPLDKMLSGDLRNIIGPEWESVYGRGWLLTHLLSFDLERRGQLTKYLDEIQSGVPSLRAAEDAFGDLKTLDRDLDRYFRRDIFTVATIPASKLRIPPVTVRALSPGEEKLIDAKIRLARGGKVMRPKELVGNARRAAAEYPDDVHVQTIAAEVELAAENWKEVFELADRALAKNPRSFDALIAKGRATLELGKANPAGTNWTAVRDLFLRANQIDKEAAEPLVLFYRTFVAQGVRPT